MSDVEFKCLIRFISSALKNALNEPDPEKKKAKMDEILNNLQQTLEG